MKRRLVSQAMAAAWATRALPILSGPSPGSGRKAAGESGTVENVLRYAFQVD